MGEGDKRREVGGGAGTLEGTQGPGRVGGKGDDRQVCSRGEFERVCKRGNCVYVGKSKVMVSEGTRIGVGLVTLVCPPNLWEEPNLIFRV